MTMTLLDAAVDVAATARLIRLVTQDRLTAGLRERWIEAAYVAAGRAEEHRAKALSWAEVAEDDEDAPAAAYLAGCRWCVGIYAAVVVRCLPRWVRVVLATAWAGAAVDGLV